MLHGVPAAALATVLGSDRDAICKALFEARRSLRARLAANEREAARPAHSREERYADAGCWRRPWLWPPYGQETITNHRRCAGGMAGFEPADGC